MTPREQHLWDALYAASFVIDFDNNGGSEGWVSQAEKRVNAERPITIADLGVQRLREWKRDENASAGEKLAEGDE